MERYSKEKKYTAEEAFELFFDKMQNITID